jgi:transcription elongation factor Elf1
LEKDPNRTCPRCGQPELNIYYSEKADNCVGAWCEYCNMKAYYDGEQLVPIGS